MLLIIECKRFVLLFIIILLSIDEIPNKHYIIICKNIKTIECTKKKKLYFTNIIT